VAKTQVDDGWFEVSDRDWIPRLKTKKLKLLADAQVPEPVIAEIASAGIPIKAISGATKRAPDATVLQLAEKNGRVLLTLDSDFWGDKKHPLQSVQRGIIFVAEAPGAHDRILRAFGLVYSCFAKSYPLDWWSHMKVRAVLGEFELKMRTWEGKVAHYRMRLRNGFVVAKES
jgi:hypothetical protein